MNVDIPCVCGRHETDSVTLRETLDFRSAIAIRNAAIVLRTEDPDASVAEILATLSEQYLLFGVESWTLADAKGKPLPVSRAAIREHLLSRPDVAVIVADAADGLYAEAVVLPLLVRASTSSPPRPTDGSTSAPTGSETPRPKPSKRSSITTSPTAATATTMLSLAGGSNS